MTSDPFASASIVFRSLAAHVGGYGDVPRADIAEVLADETDIALAQHRLLLVREAGVLHRLLGILLVPLELVGIQRQHGDEVGEADVFIHDRLPSGSRIGPGETCCWWSYGHRRGRPEGQSNRN